MNYDERRSDCEYRRDGCKHPQAGFRLAGTLNYERLEMEQTHEI